MKQQLLHKLNLNHPNYTDNEIRWLITHIGDSDSKIRDDLVCETFGKGFLNEEFSVVQVKFLIRYVLNENLLFYQLKSNGRSTLVRSFTCLLVELIIQTDGDRDSCFYGILSELEREKLFSAVLDYVKLEHDFTGYSIRFGWVDSISHLADTVEITIRHDAFSKKDCQLFLKNLKILLDKVRDRFMNGEEWRISNSLLAVIETKKIASAELCEWISQFTFENEDNLVTLHQFENLKSILLDLYIKLERNNLLENNVRQKIVSDYLEKY